MNNVPSQELTIDELAQRTGLTTRNIRAYQSRGMIPPPAKRGRTGYYGQEHVERLDLIREMRGQGLALDMIQRMLEISDDQIGGLSFARTVVGQFGPEPEPEVFTLVELSENWHTTDLEVFELAQQAGLVRVRDDGMVESVDPRLTDIGQELLALGMPIREMIGVVMELRRRMEEIAERFKEIYLKYVWEPFELAGMPEDRWDEVAQALERLRPVADEATLAIYRRAIELAVSKAVDEKIGRLREMREQG